MKKWAIVAGLLFGLSGILTACNTTKGIGEDLQAAGKAVTHSAEKSGAKKS